MQVKSLLGMGRRMISLWLLGLFLYASKTGI